MRTTLCAIAFASLCALMYVACDQSGGSVAPESIHDWRASEPLAVAAASSSGYILNSGPLHNQGLTYIRANYNSGLNFTAATDQATYLLSLAAGYYQSHGGWDSSLNNNSGSREALAVMLNRRYPAADADLWYALKTNAIFTRNVPAAELSIIDNAVHLFSMPGNGMSRWQIADRIIGRADSLLGVWAATFQGGSGGEVSGGFLSIMRSSAAYWRDHPVTSGEASGPPPELGQIVQVDAVGFLYGWLMSAAQEIDANGHLDVNNQYKRIGAGLSAAGSWSMGGMVRRYFGL